jgi:hypothetical protein
MSERKQISWVKAGDTWVDIDTTEFVDIEEGLYGDEYTFNYEGQEYKSQIVRGSQPG